MASMTMDTNEVRWSENDEIDLENAIETDTGIQEIALQLERDVTITPDTDLNVDPSEEVPLDTDSSNSSGVRDQDEVCESDDSLKPLSSITNGEIKTLHKDANGTVKQGSKLVKHMDNGVKHGDKRVVIHSRTQKVERKSDDSCETDSVKSRHGCAPAGAKNPLKILKRLTKFDKSKKKSDFRSEFAVVAVDRLPQVFVVKYLGHREVGGVSGLHHVRKPVDEMVKDVRTKLEGKDEINLPLMYVIVTPKGLDLRDHQSNKVKNTAPLGVIPIDFISYGVQDIKYWRIFTCIVVRTLSWQSRTATCHAFLCDSSQSGRKMALALGSAFSIYTKRLSANGKTHNFQVELRPPDELVDGLHECEV